MGHSDTAFDTCHNKIDHFSKKILKNINLSQNKFSSQTFYNTDKFQN